MASPTAHPNCSPSTHVLHVLPYWHARFLSARRFVLVSLSLLLFPGIFWRPPRGSKVASYNQHHAISYDLPCQFDGINASRCDLYYDEFIYFYCLFAPNWTGQRFHSIPPRLSGPRMNEGFRLYTCTAILRVLAHKSFQTLLFSAYWGTIAPDADVQICRLGLTKLQCMILLVPTR